MNSSGQGKMGRQNESPEQLELVGIMGYLVQAHMYFPGEASKDQIISLVHPRLVTKPGLRVTSLDFPLRALLTPSFPLSTLVTFAYNEHRHT